MKIKTLDTLNFEIELETLNFGIELTPKSKLPLNPLKGTLKTALIIRTFPFRGQG
jgi:hypothetical protein